jgi:hypothetical protein
MSEIVDIKTKKRRTHAPRDLVAIDKTSGPARFYDKMMRDIETDLGGRRNLSRIQMEWIKGFCGCATRLEYLNYQIMLGEASDCDVGSYAQLANTMLRLGSKLGLSPRHNKDGKRTFSDLLAAEQIEDNKLNEKRREEFEAKQRAAASAPATEPPNAS